MAPQVVPLSVNSRELLFIEDRWACKVNLRGGAGEGLFDLICFFYLIFQMCWKQNPEHNDLSLIDTDLVPMAPVHL